MAKLTNLQLLMAAVVVVALSIVIFVLPTSANPTATVLLAIGAVVLIVLTFRIIQGQSQRTKSLWLQRPVSDRFGRRLINSVVGVWLCVITAIFAGIAVVLNHSSNIFVAVLVLTYVGAAVAGRAMQNRYRSTNWLPYGFAFTGALFIAACIFCSVPR